MYYVVKYTGKFGFIKPWTAVRDGETFSQQFLTPSIIEGMEKKLFPELLENHGNVEKIKRHKLSYSSISIQAEATQVKGITKLPNSNLGTRGAWDSKKKKINFAPLSRGVLLDPILYLAFDCKEDALIASKQHLCLCRNEDIVLPDAEIYEMSEDEFAEIKGFELRFGESEYSFLVGFNRFDKAKPMYGWIEYAGQSLLNNNK